MKKFIILIMAVSALGFSGCAKKKSSASRIGGDSRGNTVTTDGNGAVANTGITTPCSSQYPYARMLLDSASQAQGFRASYVDFFSATETVANINAALGDIDGTGQSQSTGVNVQVLFKVTNNQISSAVLNLLIYDSFVSSNGMTPFEIGYTNIVSSNYNASSGAFTIVFQDSAGTVTVTGTAVNSAKGPAITGKVLFANSKSADGSAFKTGSLGQFQTPVCAVISQ